MSKIERRFADGEVIFKESEPSTTAFVIVEGRVQLTKKARSGPVRLATLAPGEMFGEMGIIDKSPRSATATAKGPVVLDVVEREGFLGSLQENPKVALSVIANLAERLRETNERIVGPAAGRQPQAGAPLPNQVNPGLMDFIFGIKKRRSQTLQFRLARMSNDDDGSQTARVAEIFAKNKGVKFKTLDEALEVDPREQVGKQFARAARLGRTFLDREKADLLMWGEVNDTRTAIHLRFISVAEEEDHPGGFLVTDRLSLPVEFDPEFSHLLRAVAFAATVPRSAAHRLQIKAQLLPALEATRKSGQQLPIELPVSDQASLHTCYGNVTALIGYFANDLSWYRKAAEAYQEALEYLSGTDAPVEFATAQRHLALVLQVLGERTGDTEILTSSINALTDATKVFTKEDLPWEWAAIQNRMGAVYYRLDLIDGDPETLKQSIAAFHAALQVYSRAGAPFKWAEVKNNIGQALQIWGDLGRSEETLERAIDACREALLVRTERETPLAWAASQNNLGSALFLLGKMIENREYLDAAAEAFGHALEVYQAHDATRLAAVADRNLEKVEDILAERRQRKVATLDWETAEPGLEALPDIPRQLDRDLKAEI